MTSPAPLPDPLADALAERFPHWTAVADEARLPVPAVPAVRCTNATVGMARLELLLLHVRAGRR